MCAWLGNTADVVRKHYLRGIDDHFGQAHSGARCGVPTGTKVHDTSGQEATAEPVDSTNDSENKGRNVIRPMKNGVPGTLPKTPISGPYWTRTSDLSDVNRAL